jgi:hypothetical protein
MVPLPFVGEEDTEYVARKAVPEVAPLGVLVSSLPVTLPVGLEPSAVNSPVKASTAKETGFVAKPA